MRSFRQEAPRAAATEEAPAVASDWWQGSTLGRPERFVAKPVAVSACRHDGSDAQVSLVLDWVGRVGSSQVRARAEFGSVVVIEQPWPAEPVRLAPGMFLVLFEGEWGGWAVYSADQFLTAFEPRPRELPIFNDGEVA